MNRDTWLIRISIALLAVSDEERKTSPLDEYFRV
jgi:hypothetical protein